MHFVPGPMPIPALACSDTTGLGFPSGHSYGYDLQSNPATSRICPAPNSGMLTQYAGLMVRVFFGRANKNRSALKEGQQRERPESKVGSVGQTMIREKISRLCLFTVFLTLETSKSLQIDLSKD